MIATTAPTGASMPSPTLISTSVPATVAGTSIDVLSVSISKRSSPGTTLSPTFLNQFVILPELTVSPSCGINTSIIHRLRPQSSRAPVERLFRNFGQRQPRGDRHIVGYEAHARRQRHGLDRHPP